MLLGQRDRWSHSGPHPATKVIPATQVNENLSWKSRAVSHNMCSSWGSSV